MPSLFETWDGETLVVRHDRPSGAVILIALHSSRLGPAGGGTRMKHYPDLDAALRDAFRLAEGMSYKFALADFPMGGAKAVIKLPADFDTGERLALLRRYGELVHQLNGQFYTGPDVGTTPYDMDIIAETGAPYIFARSTAAAGPGGSSPPTALGVFSAMQATVEHLYGQPELSARRVLVQGAGGVGGELIDYLLQAGAEVLFSEVEPGLVRHFRDDKGLAYIPAEAVFDTPCDLFSPCALGGVLNADSITRLRCRAVVGAANNQLAAAEDAERLHNRGILYAPDFAVNVGGAIAVVGMESLGWSRAEAEQKVRDIGRTVTRIFALAEAEDVTTETAARRIAEARLHPVE